MTPSLASTSSTILPTHIHTSKHRTPNDHGEDTSLEAGQSVAHVCIPHHSHHSIPGTDRMH
ncbi:hypothetical protein COCSUDRAFT_33667 [Coccomyxa subellipsoidea C-169]|uniref:Uncharacterized protein n=1 Tax=Coccomyxa subellipsoidea (strain C-169) TaxID=574566 RepID=I0YSS1_COCSC|nr:hypothetical protein COCSUDRAFT_33667 [Coccomyxa subellipsoidea C-169]EIE21440.1 hypothetical protein COCSUDRAFT_33667 [Coccomyxa subellipsoidea C-169]|eukprot:XP_005645984.1 hypothetical protein COCSUDRAFT_33667 [Coccomyxa subellipsoidea C-169]